MNIVDNLNEQQPKTKKGFWQPRRIIRIILIILFVGIIIWLINFIGFFNGPIPSITVDPAHQQCTVDDDCTTVGTLCTCKCPEPVNKDYADSYFDQLSEVCEGYKGMMCDISCDFTVVCDSGVCVKQDYTEVSNKPCDNIDTSGPELTFEMNYCAGANCFASTKDECEKIDVIKENLTSGKDGKPDCMWENNNCGPNK